MKSLSEADQITDYMFELLDSNDTPNLVLVSIQLSGDNYNQWCRAMTMALLAKNKLSFVKRTMPDTSAENFTAWSQIDRMVRSWIINSLNKDLLKFVKGIDDLAASAVEVWCNLHDRYSPDSGLRMLNIHRDIAAHQQGNDSISVYFKKLKELWNELYTSFPPTNCRCDAKRNHFCIHHDEQHLIQFLMGLNQNYVSLQKEILSKNPLPPLGVAYTLVLKDEAKRGLAAVKISYDNDPQNKDHLQCAYCKVPRHTIDTCYTLNGYPPNYYQDKQGKFTGLIASEKGEGTDIELQHFSHEHPLKLSNEHKNEEVFCSGCNLVLPGAHYKCSQCNFVLHDFCARVPQELNHPAHPQHPLSLLLRTPYSNGSFLCDACGATGQGFHFSCSICQFDLDVHCAKLPHSCRHDNHPHLLTLVQTPSCRCSGCGQQIPAVSFSCSDCSYNLHVACAALPATITYKDHEHPLNLSNSTKIDENVVCALCREQLVNQMFWFYSCKDCDYVAHINCAASMILGLGKDYSSSIEVENRHQGPVELMKQNISSLKESATSKREMEFKSPSKNKNQENCRHRHPLFLIDESKITKLFCNWCHQLLSGSIYGCRSCDYFVHEQCYKSPNQISHPFHQEHPLILIPRILRRREFCKACDSFIEGTTYGCQRCHIFLHPECALLPQRVKKRHEHPFNLKYAIKDDGSNEYYCDVCEERLYEKWIYYCDICEYASHLACATSKALPPRKWQRPSKEIGNDRRSKSDRAQDRPRKR